MITRFYGTSTCTVLILDSTARYQGARVAVVVENETCLLDSKVPPSKNGLSLGAMISNLDGKEANE